MDEMKSYNELLGRVQELVAKIEKADLSLDELFELERLTGKLHERSIILRYKAFENKLGITKGEMVDQKPLEKAVEPIKTEIKEEEKEEEDELEFTIFDEDEDEVEMSFDVDEEIVPEVPAAVKTPEVKIVETEKKQTAAASTDSENTSFIDRFKSEDNSLSHKFAESKLDSLIGAFGLNEKLRYINDLFDGSSEMFSDAIKALDGKESFTAATALISELAEQHEWDPEEESVTEFMTYIKRRYA